MIPVSSPSIPKHAKQYIDACLSSGWVSSQGPYIQKFERAFAAYHTTLHAITTTSGTAALHLALAALGIGKGNEVIVTNFTMVAPVFAILYTGAHPVFIDVKSDTWNMDVAQIEKHITPQTKAILAVHIYGHPVDMETLLAIAKKHKLYVIEDAAEALGSLYKNKKVGTLGDIGCFSFYANKLVTTGEGGMVITKSTPLAKRMRLLKDMAHSPKKRFLHTDLAFNYRMTNLQAALGLAGIEDIEKNLTKKRHIAFWYRKALANLPLQLPVEKSWATNSYWMYAVVLKRGSRDKLRTYLATKGIETRDFFIPMHKQPALKKHGVITGRKFAVSEYISARGLYLPSGVTLTKKEVQFISHTIHKWYDM